MDLEKRLFIKQGINEIIGYGLILVISSIREREQFTKNVYFRATFNSYFGIFLESEKKVKIAIKLEHDF